MGSANAQTPTPTKQHEPAMDSAPNLVLSEPESPDSKAGLKQVDTTDESDEGKRPALPPRPMTIELLGSSQTSPANTLRLQKQPSRPQLQSTATTAVSLTDIQTQSYRDGSRETYAQSSISSPSRKSSHYGSPAGLPRKSNNGSEGDDNASLRSYAPTTIGTGSDIEGMLEEAMGTEQHKTAWNLADEKQSDVDFGAIPYDNEEPTADFSREFDEIGELDEDNSNQGRLLDQWRSKRKHFLILSAAGKPIYNRHGSDNLISGEIGVIQTIISFYEGAHNQLRSFTAGKSRFVVMTRGPLYLVAISKLGESDNQLQGQLEALYMQILSTLTLPRLSQMFSLRPSTDLRRPLEGTDVLLDALSDSFTRGSPSALLSALECLKLKKRDRQLINNTMLKTKCKDLLYGLVVAGGRLVSVVRPRSHSLHPGDLQLIFNMLFEAGGVKAGGGDSWIPMCLPGFNKNGYLHMYVSFLEMATESNESTSQTNPEEGIAILLISANKESFYELRTMRDDLVEVCASISSLSFVLDYASVLDLILSILTSTRSSIRMVPWPRS
jgi:hypothetical protein